MAYSSPLGFNFKLERSLSAASEDKNQDTPKREKDGTRSKIVQEPECRKISAGSKNYSSPPWQRQTNNWKSPNPRNSQYDSPIPVEQLYHPSMLENPWEELERNLNSS